MTRKYIRLEVMVVINVVTGAGAASLKKVNPEQLQLTIKNLYDRRWWRR
jgi:hypothetical protein